MGIADESPPGDGFIRNAVEIGNTVAIALRGSRCQGEYESGERCEYTAKHFVLVSDDGPVLAFCGLHITDTYERGVESKYLNQHPDFEVSFEVFSREREFCDKRVYSEEYDEWNTCGDTGAFCFFDRREDGHTTTRCVRHCRPSWLRDFF